MPEVLAEPALGSELTVGREVVVELIRAQVLAFLVTDVKPDVQVAGLVMPQVGVVETFMHRLQLVILIYFAPSYPPHRSPKVGFHVKRLAEYRT